MGILFLYPPTCYNYNKSLVYGYPVIKELGFQCLQHFITLTELCGVRNASCNDVLQGDQMAEVKQYAVVVWHRDMIVRYDIETAF